MDMAAASAPDLDRRAFLMLAAAIGAAYLPLLAVMVGSGMAWESMHPAINAMLNATSTVLLGAGWLAIRKRRIELHWRCMIGAFMASTVFLLSYVARFIMSGTHRYPGEGWDKTAYLVILFSHMVLALVALPLILRLLWLARARRYVPHKRLARWAWPIWMYVSVTGVVVYLMLYPIAAAVYGP